MNELRFAPFLGLWVNIAKTLLALLAGYAREATAPPRFGGQRLGLAFETRQTWLAF